MRSVGQIDSTTHTCTSYSEFEAVGDPNLTSFTQTPVDGACYRFQYSTVDLLGNATTSDTLTLIVDSVAPVCGGTWTQSPTNLPTWQTTAGATRTYVLSGSSDSLTGLSATYRASNQTDAQTSADGTQTCVAAANATCQVTIYDVAGNTNV